MPATFRALRWSPTSGWGRRPEKAGGIANDVASTGDVRSAAVALCRASDAFLRGIARLDSATSGGEAQRILGESALAATQVREASERLNKISQSFEKTEGSLRSVMFRADSVLIKVDKGQGTLGLMVNDPGLYRHTDSVMVDIRGLIADIKKNPRRYIKLSIF